MFFLQTCSSLAVSNRHQAADGPFPALFGRHGEHALHLQDDDDNMETEEQLLLATEDSIVTGEAAAELVLR